MDFIVGQKGFWEPDDESVLKAIHEGFIQTHYAMWKELGKGRAVRGSVTSQKSLPPSSSKSVRFFAF